MQSHAGLYDALLHIGSPSRLAVRERRDEAPGRPCDRCEGSEVVGDRRVLLFVDELDPEGLAVPLDLAFHHSLPSGR